MNERESSFIEKISRFIEEKGVVVRKSYAGRSYDYIVLPLGEQGVVDARILLAAAFEMLRISNINEADVILVPEAMGIHIGCLMSLISGKPLVIARKRGYGLPGEIVVEKSTGYEKSYLYINNLDPSLRILLADIMISTGGTICALIKTLTSNGYRIVDVVVLLEKPRFKGVERVLRETGYKVKSLIKLFVENGEAKAIPNPQFFPKVEAYVYK